MRNQLKSPAPAPDFEFMLAINARVSLHIDHREHAWALRTIGQDLASLRPQYLEIEYTGRLYVARGRMQPSPTPRSPVAKLPAEFRAAVKAPPRSLNDIDRFERRYPLSEIHRLDEAGLVRRKNYPESPDIYVLGERLRTVGKMIEAKGGQLLKLTTDSHRVTFIFRDRSGALCSEEHSNSALYKTQQDGNANRGSGRPRDPWEFSAPKNAEKLSSVTN
jgi:hypothetical protein